MQSLEIKRFNCHLRSGIYDLLIPRDRMMKVENPYHDLIALSHHNIHNTHNICAKDVMGLRSAYIFQCGRWSTLNVRI